MNGIQDQFYRSNYVAPDDTSVRDYLNERKDRTALRIEALTKLDLIIQKLTRSKQHQVFGMSLSQAFDKGTEVISQAEIPFLKELLDIDGSVFLSAVFDIPLNHRRIFIERKITTATD